MSSIIYQNKFKQNKHTTVFDLVFLFILRCYVTTGVRSRWLALDAAFLHAAVGAAPWGALQATHAARAQWPALVQAADLHVGRSTPSGCLVAFFFLLCYSIASSLHHALSLLVLALFLLFDLVISLFSKQKSCLFFSSWT
jgi:hypothetical protein